MQTVFQAGAGDGGGVEMSTEGLGTKDISLGGSMGPTGAIGVYGAFGEKFSKTVATPPLGC